MQGIIEVAASIAAVKKVTAIYQRDSVMQLKMMQKQKKKQMIKGRKIKRIIGKIKKKKKMMWQNEEQQWWWWKQQHPHLREIAIIIIIEGSQQDWK